MSKWGCDSGEYEGCYTQKLEEEFEKDPHFRDCNCGREACFVCNFYRSKGAVIHFAPERTEGGFASMIARWKFYELYDYAASLEEELALLRSDEVNLFANGNILRGTRERDQGLYVMVCDGMFATDSEFLGTVLVDYYNRYKLGTVKAFRADTWWWAASSLQEAANEKG